MRSRWLIAPFLAPPLGPLLPTSAMQRRTLLCHLLSHLRALCSALRRSLPSSALFRLRCVFLKIDIRRIVFASTLVPLA